MDGRDAFYQISGMPHGHDLNYKRYNANASFMIKEPRDDIGFFVYNPYRHYESQIFDLTIYIPDLVLSEYSDELECLARDWNGELVGIRKKMTLQFIGGIFG